MKAFKKYKIINKGYYLANWLKKLIYITFW